MTKTIQLNNFYTDVIVKDPRFNWKDEIRDTALLEPVTRNAVAAIIKGAAALGIHLHSTETYRSCADQEKLFEAHLTQLQHQGVHHFGLACDFVEIKPNGTANWNTTMPYLKKLAEDAGLICGCDWGLPYQEHGFHDWDHVQRVTVADQEKLLSGAWYPDANYRPFIKDGKVV